MNKPPESIKEPKNLKKGDTIGLISTARKIKPEELEFSIKLLESWGLKVLLGRHLFKEHHQFAGTDKERSVDFQEMLNNPLVKAILCVRGGYGTVRIIDKLDFSLLKTHSKWIAGFSDVTALHSTLHNLGLTSLHSTMPISFSSNTKKSLESLRNVLFGKQINYTFLDHPLNKKGIANAPVIGGNLSILYSLLGSPSDIETDGKILFLEDLDEYLYHIDRMMMNLKRNKKLSRLAGLIIGSMSEMKDNKVSFGKTAYEIILDAVLEYNYPVAFNFPAGHINNNNAIILGKSAKLVVDRVCSLKYK